MENEPIKYKIGDEVTTDHYNHGEVFKVVGIREEFLELRGDWSGGTHNVDQAGWMPIAECRILAPDGMRLIRMERQRQIEKEGWSTEHDDLHTDGQLSRAALAYEQGDKTNFPWDEEYWKPTTELRDHVKAGALLMADKERIERRIAQIAARINELQNI